ncbi:hypothetical protein C0431_03495 [bacterium]|jgi:heme exporter protein C|nr:hypothetical protein [bacterium]
MKSAWFAVLGIAMGLMLIGTMLVPDAQLFRDPTMARIMFTHVPCAMICSGFLIASAWHGFKVLKNYNDTSATKLHAAVELGSLFAALTMVTGILFSKIMWGEYWHGDPRQVSFLIVLFIYGGLLALRAAFPDPIRRDRNTASYALAAILPSIFLTFVYPRLKAVQQQSFHPSNTIVEGQMDIFYSVGLYGSLVLIAIIAIVVFKLRVRTELLARKLENHGNLETHSGDSASPRMVRPVAVSPEHLD